MNNDIIIYDKTHTTFEEQLNILRKGNLIIDNENSAIVILSRVNYYNFL